MENVSNCCPSCRHPTAQHLSGLQHQGSEMPISYRPRSVVRSMALMFFFMLGTGVVAAQEVVDNPGRLLASNCFQCHGTNGTPVAGGFDKIAGESVNEIVSELSEMRAEAIAMAEHPIMTVHAQAYSLAEIDMIARYLANVGAVASGSIKLTVAKTGTGSGTITSSPSDINCGSTCSKTYIKATRVTLRATAAKGSVFAGWNGACSVANSARSMPCWSAPSSAHPSPC